MIDFLKGLVDKLDEFLKDACININKQYPDLDKYLKKEYMVKTCCSWYDKYIDQVTTDNPEGRLPGLVDLGIKWALIPFIADVVVAELKKKGLIK